MCAFTICAERIRMKIERRTKKLFAFHHSSRPLTDTLLPSALHVFFLVNERYLASLSGLI
ncbi:hypothetical protein M5X02_12410 [Paenibacillus alvei]|uniref:hypothetical protein n=1 Tax=Paenibacillus TaxID=44249 RepID=UPI0002ED3848|nr:MULTISPECIES: hypothetical protein [Paenibacillus]MCY9541457.1 hypothetical protein [Paenibacillus alvei]